MPRNFGITWSANSFMLFSVYSRGALPTEKFAISKPKPTFLAGVIFEPLAHGFRAANDHVSRSVNFLPGGKIARARLKPPFHHSHHAGKRSMPRRQSLLRRRLQQVASVVP